MRPLRHSASFPSLPTTSALALPPSPSPLNAPSQPSSPSHLHPPPSHRPSHTSLLFHPSPLPSPHPSPPSSTPAPSPHYTFPSHPLTPPPHFLRIESSLYRCAAFSAVHFPFVSALRLKAVVLVSPEPPPSALLHHLHSSHIAVHHLHPQHHHTPHAPAHHHPAPLTPSLIKAALEYMLRAQHQPLLLLSAGRCSPELCLLVGCLRRVQGWCYSFGGGGVRAGGEGGRGGGCGCGSGVVGRGAAGG